MSRIAKQEPLTSSERFLTRLGEASFLSLWSYPSLTRDQGGGKELCDLLVVCGKVVIVFSDKLCEMADTGDLNLDWKRWHKKAVVRSAVQAWGAERWLTEFPDRVFLDRGCVKPFPLTIPRPSEWELHLVVVANGAAERCRTHFSGAASFILDYGAGLMNGAPFVVGDIDPSKTFVHVFNEYTLGLVLSNLDTVSDLSMYLRKKRILCRSGIGVTATGEEDLLAVYLSDVNADGEHDFVFDPRTTSLIIDEGQWEHFQNRPERRAQLAVDRISSIWDGLIEVFAKHIRQGTEEYSNWTDVRDVERALQFMAAERRFHRRLLGQKLWDLFAPLPQGKVRASYTNPQDCTQAYYVFAALGRSDNQSYEEYRELRRANLSARCHVVRHKHPEAVHIIGIASDPRDVSPSSEDLMYLDGSQWTDELDDQAREWMIRGNLFHHPHQTRITGKEYPNSEMAGGLHPKPGRNETCPCGSGKKYKRCHGG